MCAGKYCGKYVVENMPAVENMLENIWWKICGQKYVVENMLENIWWKKCGQKYVVENMLENRCWKYVVKNMC